MDMVICVQIPDNIISILYGANTFGKRMNPIILSPAMGK